jgi:hypothetical protein
LGMCESQSEVRTEIWYLMSWQVFQNDGVREKASCMASHLFVIALMDNWFSQFVA